MKSSNAILGGICAPKLCTLVKLNFITVAIVIYVKDSVFVTAKDFVDMLNYYANH